MSEVIAEGRAAVAGVTDPAERLRRIGGHPLPDTDDQPVHRD